MPLVSIIMPCYNAEKYLRPSVQSIIDQTLEDWELLIVNDGSNDCSLSIANEMASSDRRIKVVSKANGGYVSARLYGYSLIDPTSKYIIFYDADDKLNREMLLTLATEMERDATIGAVYCDHRIMNELDEVLNQNFEMPRLIPTRFWVKQLDSEIVRTPFISIFCWTKMIEPMTLIRKQSYDETPGWDADFGIGQGNIGEGVYLFSEIALKWKVHLINQPLYYYRRYSTQMSAVSTDKMNRQANKVIEKWKERLHNGIAHPQKVRLAILFFNYRLSVFKRWGSFKHQLRYHPGSAFLSAMSMTYEYMMSLPLIFTFRKLTDDLDYT